MTKQMLNNRKASTAATVEACEEKIPNQKDISMSNNTTLSTEIQNVSNFNFGESSIRVVSINGEPWFIAKDVCSSLNISNVTDALLKLDDDEKMILDNTLGLTESIAKQVQEVNLVSESGMYTLVLRCRDAVKKGSVSYRFRKWVTSEVLPQIRKTGRYEKLDTPISLTKEHQQFIKDFVKNRTLQLPKDKQAKCAIMQWSALKSHFGKSYKEIDDSQFVDAISLLARLPIEGELIIDEPKLNTIQNSEETLALLIKLYSYCHQAHEMQEKLFGTGIAIEIENAIGGHYLHNFRHPLEQAMKIAKEHINAHADRLVLLKAVNNLLN